jgi:hypothetical protein
MTVFFISKVTIKHKMKRLAECWIWADFRIGRYFYHKNSKVAPKICLLK